MNKKKKQNLIIASALKVFSKNGFYNTTIANIAQDIGMSVGNFYNYFPSKKNLARAAITFVTKKLAASLSYINNKEISQKEKIYLFVTEYFGFIQQYPEMIEYFFRVYLSNRELFCEDEDCGFALAKDFINEIQRYVQDGVESGEFKEKNFFVAFSSIAGILGGMTFLSGEHVFDEELDVYCDEVSETIYNALR
ncbi:MAG: TetR/AcrR family transcriptional regulator [Sulfurospirillaceae bacterium]|nr:TetR/AcrR family transcriptional regulator [Sulfurospirillaceae bacterium]